MPNDENLEISRINLECKSQCTNTKKKTMKLRNNSLLKPTLFVKPVNNLKTSSPLLIKSCILKQKHVKINQKFCNFTKKNSSQISVQISLDYLIYQSIRRICVLYMKNSVIYDFFSTHAYDRHTTYIYKVSMLCFFSLN